MEPPPEAPGDPPLAGAGDAAGVAAVLAAAFQDDPVFSHCIPDPGARRERLPAVFTAFAELFIPLGWSQLIPGEAAALWAPPDASPFAGDGLDAFAARMDALLGDDAARFNHVGDVLSAHEPEAPHAYLQLIGVVPGRRGRGSGGRLLAAALARCDAAGAPAYLEATAADSRRLYARHGFRVTRAIAVPGGPTLWGMWRDPRPAAAPSLPARPGVRSAPTGTHPACPPERSR